MKPLLSVEGLTVSAGPKDILKEISFDLPAGKITAIAGGSGSGKTTIGLSILRLLSPGLKIRQGRLDFEGRDLRMMTEDQMRSVRGRRIGMVFQEPLSAFDPLFTIGSQMDEALQAHTDFSRQERTRKILQTLAEVELPDPQRAYKCFPHQLSGGMRQRAMAAQAMVCGPSLIIADEPTSSLDMTLQVKIMHLLARFKTRNITVLLITHDLGMVAHLADEVIILKEGRIVEQGAVAQVYGRPQHEYTRALVEAFQ